MNDIHDTTSRIALALSVATTLAFGASALLAQETESPTFEDEVAVTEVLIDALVTDKQGRVILGLGADDFTVLENGEEVDLLGVSFYSSQERVESDRVEIPGFDLSEIPEDRHFIVFIQDARSSSSASNLFTRQQQAGRDLVRWMATELQPADLVAVVSYDFKLKVHSDFTRDRERLAHAVDNAVRGIDTESEWPSRKPPESEIGPLRRALPEGKALRKATGNLYKAVTAVAKAAATIPGRKNLVYIGTGFDAVRSSDFFRMTPMLQQLNDANVAAYVLDLLGSEVRHSSRPSLERLALATGGEFFFTFVRFSSALEEIAETTSGYYLLAYRSGHPAGKSGYQRVKVRVANPEFRVRARVGYTYGETD